MNILITGGAGYLAGAVTDLLKDSEHEIQVYDSLLYEDQYLKDVPFARGDVRDTNTLQPFLEWADCVIWLAALVGDGACALNPGVTKEVNQDAVKFLADKFNGRIIFVSTCSVYGAQNGELVEDSPTNPLSLYAATKLAAEKYLGLKNAIIFRLGTLYGVSDTYSRLRMDLVVNTLTARAVTENKLQVFGGDQYRPLLHVRDAAQAIVDNITTSFRGVYNLHGVNMRIIELARLVQKHVDGTMVEKVETTFQDARNYRVSSAKAADILSFKPVETPEDGILEVKWLLENGRIKDIHNPRYSNAGYLEELWKA